MGWWEDFQSRFANFRLQPYSAPATFSPYVTRPSVPGQVVDDAATPDPYNPYADYPGPAPVAEGWDPRRSGFASNPQTQQQPTGDPYAFLNDLAKMFSQTGVSPNSEAAKAAGAYNAALAALSKEKGAAKKRNKENRADTKADYGYLEQQYDKDAAQSAKDAAAAEAKYNQEMMQGVTETSDAYNKVAAEQQAEQAALGLGASTQALARQSLENQSMQAQDMQRMQAETQRDYAVNQENINGDYYTAGANTAVQAGNEQGQALMRDLEDILLKLSGKEADTKTQQAQAANAARQWAQNFNLQRIGTGLDLNSARANIWEMLNPAAKAGSGSTGAAIASGDYKTIKETFGSGPIGAMGYLKATMPQQQANSLMAAIFADPELLNQSYAVDGNAGNKQDITNQRAEVRVREIAKKLGIPEDQAVTYYFIYSGA
jgi:hypothetical protein